MPIETFKLPGFNLPTQPEPQPNPEKKQPKIKKLDKKIEKKLEKKLEKGEPVLDSEVEDHQRHVLMLSRYGSSKRFGEYLKKMKFKLGFEQLNKLSFKDLKSLLKRVRVVVNNRQTSDMWSDMISGRFAGWREGYYSLQSRTEVQD